MRRTARISLPYFAYGSNLKRARLAERVPGSRPIGMARLDGYELRCDKRGADGSGKANLHLDPGQHVWGALYELTRGGFEQLDRFEGGYQRLEVPVEIDAGGEPDRLAITYRSDRVLEEAIPFAWYRRLILEGAREHALPPSWIERLEALPARDDQRGWRPTRSLE